MCRAIVNFFKGIKSGWKTQKSGGVLDLVWCTRCRTRQPVYMEGPLIKCSGCQNIIMADNYGIVDVDAVDVDAPQK
jgi:hypothetical protein